MATLARKIAPAIALAGAAGVARAHEIAGSRFEVPIPLPLLFGGAGLTVALTAVVLSVSVRSEPLGDMREVGTLPPAVAVPVRFLARWLFVLVVGGAILAGLFGRQVPAENLATVFVWPLWLKGVGLVAVLVGSPWPLLSPWRAIYDLVSGLEGEDVSFFEYPDRLAEWPALFGFVVVVGVLENLTVFPRSPRLTAQLVAAYAFVMVIGGVAFGREWFRRADFFEVLYRLFGRVAPLERRPSPDGGVEVVLRPPWTDCTPAVGNLVLVAFVVATVYTVSFDGFLNTPEFREALLALREAAGFGPFVAMVLYLAGLVGFVAAFVVAAGLAQQAAGSTFARWRGAALAFAPTVLPIAVAYELAHNYPLVIRNLGGLVSIAGSYLLATSPEVSLLGWLSLPAFWASQVFLIVAGHVVAVVAAHYAALGRFGTESGARRAHVPLTALMVGYTVLSLWIISRPVVAG